MAADDTKFGTCCSSLKEAMSDSEFEPLITVGDDGVLYMSLGMAVYDDDEPTMVDHPMFFCPFCGTKLQTPEEVDAKSAGTGGDDESAAS